MHVLVIGAGAVGLATAYHLKRLGADVSVVDAATECAQGASYGNGGYLQATLPDPWNAPGALRLFFTAWRNRLLGRTDRSAFSVHTRALPGLLRWGSGFLTHATPAAFEQALLGNYVLAQYSRTAMLDCVANENLDFAFSQSGSLIIFRDTASFDAYADLAASAPGANATQSLSAAAAVDAEPALAPIADKLAGAIRYPLDLAGNSQQFCAEITRLLTTRGVEFSFATQVQGLKSVNGNRVRVTTTNGQREADAVVIAAGVHSPQLTRLLGQRVGIAPAKGYSISIPIEQWADKPTHVIADMGIHAGINPLGNRLRVAGTAEFCGLRPGVSAARTQYLLDLAQQVFPGFEEHADLTDIDPWGGFRPLSSDGLPYIGRLNQSGVFINSGHGGLGWTQAMGSGRALADLICGNQPQIDLHLYHPERRS